MISHSPASEFGLSQAHLEAILSGLSGGSAFLVAGQFVALDTIDAPGTGTRADAQARLLGVNGEDGELRLGEGAGHMIRVGGEEDTETRLVVDRSATLVALASLQTIGQHQRAGHGVEQFAGGGEHVTGVGIKWRFNKL